MVSTVSFSDFILPPKGTWYNSNSLIPRTINQPRTDFYLASEATGFSPVCNHIWLFSPGSEVRGLLQIVLQNSVLFLTIFRSRHQSGVCILWEFYIDMSDMWDFYCILNSFFLTSRVVHEVSNNECTFIWCWILPELLFEPVPHCFTS